MARAKKLTKKAKGTRRDAYANRRRKGLRAIIFPWFKRFGITVAVLGAVLWAGAWFFLSDADDRAGDWVHNKIVVASASLGFEVQNILIDGRVNTDPEILKAIINVQKGDPLFAFNPTQAQEALSQIAWVDTVHVERRWPDTLYISLDERKPLALWQKDKKLNLIDQYGDIIPVTDLNPFSNLVIVLGEDAPKNTEELFQTLIGEPDLFRDIESAGYIADRRWDIIMKNDIRVKLPEGDVALAWSRLAKAHAADNILDKNLMAIDLRDPERMIVRTSPGSASEYQSGITPANAKSGNNI